MTASHPQPTARTDGADIFTKRVEPDRPAPTLERELFTEPQIVQYKGVRFIEYKKDGEDRRTKKHLFAAAGGAGPWFSLWGSMNLDSQLRQLNAAAIIRLRYAGQIEERDGNKPHLFDVTATSASPAAIDQLRNVPEWKEREEWLAGRIAAALADDQAKRDAKRTAHDDGAPPHDDDDQPPF